MKTGFIFVRAFIVLFFACVFIYTPWSLVSCQGRGIDSKKSLVTTPNYIDDHDNSTATDSDIQIATEQRKLPPLEDVLREIDALSAVGVDTETFDKCKMQLATELAIRYINSEQGERGVSRPLTAPSGKVTNAWYDVDTKTIFWEYSNRGDYNLDGEVNVGDLTDLVVNFSAIVGDGIGDDAREAWLDGDQDGGVFLDDVTVLVTNFLHSVEGYRVYGANEEGGKLTLLGITEFVPRSNTYPPIMQLKPILPLGDPKAICPSPYVVFQAYDFKNVRGDLLGYVKLADISYWIAASPQKYIGGVTGNYLTIHTSASFRLVVGDDDIPIGWPDITTSLTWDFNGGAEILREYSNYVVVKLGDTGVYDCTLTSENCYGNYVDEFNLVVLDNIQPKIDSIWLDTYNTPGTSNLNIDAYACRVTEPFGISMLKIAFDTGGLNASGNSFTDGSISDGLWRYFDLLVGKSFSVCAVRIEDQFLCIYMNALTNPTASSTRSAGIGSFELFKFPTPSIRPKSVRLLTFDKTFPAVRKSRLLTRFDGDFDWQDYDSEVHASPKYSYPASRIGGREIDIMESITGKPQVTFSPGIIGDYNGDYVVDLLDISAIAIRVNQLTNDGSFDDYDIQCDGDLDGMIGVSDFTPIATHYMSGVSMFRLYRDDVLLCEFTVQSPKPLTEPIELWKEFTFTDDTATAGEHRYIVKAYDPESGIEVASSLAKYWTVE